MDCPEDLSTTCFIFFVFIFFFIYIFFIALWYTAPWCLFKGRVRACHVLRSYRFSTIIDAAVRHEERADADGSGSGGLIKFATSVRFMQRFMRCRFPAAAECGMTCN